MDDKELALAACDNGFKDGVQKLMAALLVNWIDAKKSADRDVALQRFQSTLSRYKEARQGAATSIEKVFAASGVQLPPPPAEPRQLHGFIAAYEPGKGHSSTDLTSTIVR